jgi:hypothetical protein
LKWSIEQAPPPLAQKLPNQKRGIVVENIFSSTFNY